MASPPRPHATVPVSAGKPWLFDAIDRVVPTHLSRWAMAGRIRAMALAWVICLLILAPSAAAASLAQHNGAVAVIVAVAGGHAIFVLALRCHPLQAAALRATPATFARTMAALCRVPLSLSLALFALAVLLPGAGAPGVWPMLPAAVAALLLCNALYAATAAARPASRPQAILLHGAGLYAVFYEAASTGIAYGALTLLAGCMIAALLVRQARRRYRAFHG